MGVDFLVGVFCCSWSEEGVGRGQVLVVGIFRVFWESKYGIFFGVGFQQVDYIQMGFEVIYDFQFRYEGLFFIVAGCG